MLLSLRRSSKPFFDWLADKMVSIKISANEVTLSAFVLGLWSFIMLAFQHYTIALVFLCLNRFLDGLDGAIARRTKETSLGRYLDVTLDFIFYIGFFFFFAVGVQDFYFIILMVMAAFAMDYVSMTAMAILLKDGKFKRTKGLYPFAGLMDGTETFIIAVMICVFPDGFLVMGLIYALLASFATFARLCTARNLLRK